MLSHTIEGIQPTIHGPWCILGDFNNVLSAQDRISGRLVTEEEYRHLQEMMQHTGLSEVDNIGDHFTWSNKHSVGTIYSRIDRILGNVDWFQETRNKSLKCLPPSVFDHAMLCLEENKSRITKARRFKFYNCLTNMEGFAEVVERSWKEPISGTTMFILWNKLHRLKPILTKFGKPISHMRSQLVEAITALENAQHALSHNRMDQNSIQKVKSLTNTMIKWNSLEDKILQQRSKVDWIKKGDSNNAYFYATIKTKSKQRSMDMLQKEDGTILTEQKRYST